MVRYNYPDYPKRRRWRWGSRYQTSRYYPSKKKRRYERPGRWQKTGNTVMHQGARIQAYHRSLVDAWNADLGAYGALVEWNPVLT